MNKESITTAYEVAKLAGIFDPKQYVQDKRDIFVQKIHGQKNAVLRGFKENVVLDTPRNYPEGFVESIEAVFADPDAMLIIDGNHASHAAGFTLMETAEYIRSLINPHRLPDDQIPGSLFLFASSIDDGQNKAVVDNFGTMQPTVDALHVDDVRILRSKDVHLQNIPPEKVSGLKIKQGLKIARSIRDGNIILGLSEGTVESGRYIKDSKGNLTDKLTGMMPVEPGSIEYLIEIAKRLGKNPYILPIGNMGENQLLDPNTERVTAEAKRKGIERAIPGLRKYVKPTMQSVVGYPIAYQDIVDEFGQEGQLEDGVLEQFIGEAIAQLIRPSIRGVYSEPQLLQLAGDIRLRNTSDLYKQAA